MSILVVISDPDYREFIGRLLEELELSHTPAASWRDAMMSYDRAPVSHHRLPG
jgi:CheY-like chemotaxis protein